MLFVANSARHKLFIIVIYCNYMQRGLHFFFLQEARSVAVHPNGTIVSGSDDKNIRIWSIDTGECVNVLEGHTGVRNTRLQ
jgi:WD40 repeat protein